ncbi:hypothetical protein NKR23_g10675 [Pleurostoma richardsiae]|uniref:Fucose-specific lectin n=1 Tax=Pleurostoma richardsiae TaxID=41990 RepID=A0AA38VBS9_9PEZI|nr:hypothetical protein NKR23_g10675 [Pleurostoma richardsiae]
MRDDERYPIPIQSSPDVEIPQVASPTTAEHHENSREKYAVHPSVKDDLAPSSTENAGLLQFAPTRRICGLRRRMFWVVGAAIALVVVVAAVVGGVVGSNAAHRGTSSSSPSATSTPSPTNSTAPLDASQRAITASSAAGAASNTSVLQVFYQDLNTTDILYRLVWEDQPYKEQKASLSIPPNQGTPLAVTAANSSNVDGVTLNLFYLSVNNTNDTTAQATVICQATMRCARGAGSCTTNRNVIISQNATNGVNSASGLSAVLLDGVSQFRVFYHATGGFVWALVGNNPADNGWSAMQIGGPATDGSSIAVNLESEDDMLDVIFVNDNDDVPREIQYNDVYGLDSATRANVADSPGSGWTSTARFTSCYTPGNDMYHVYYVSTTGSIVAWFRQDTNGTWNPNSAPKWGSSDGGIASVAWGDHTRLLYMSKSKLAMSASDGTVWSEVQYL